MYGRCRDCRTHPERREIGGFGPDVLLVYEMSGYPVYYLVKKTGYEAERLYFLNGIMTSFYFKEKKGKKET